MSRFSFTNLLKPSAQGCFPFLRRALNISVSFPHSASNTYASYVRFPTIAAFPNGRWHAETRAVALSTTPHPLPVASCLIGAIRVPFEGQRHGRQGALTVCRNVDILRLRG